MPVDRPTFSESWYRVAELRPRLSAQVQAHRQHYRGRLWYVLQDPLSNQYSRLSEPGYRFVALLDGRRTVAEAWSIASEQLGDSAPTQGEVIQLLGMLYASNLLRAELPPDTEGLFGRYQKRIRREVQGYMMNLLFARIPLFDPNHFLDRTVGLVGKIFSWWGAVLWLAIVSTGLYFIIQNISALTDQASKVLAPENLMWLGVAFWGVKIFHEFGHAYACKKMGRDTGSGGEVHTMGIMLLVFAPIPYVDASSAWAFPSKWQRAFVAASGMIIELPIAALAAVVWASTSPDAPVHQIAYNVMFIASVQTLLFNANPLLRFDGYYILSDLIETPNLAQRSKSYLTYLVRKYAWSVRQVQNPAHTTGEKIWFVFYGIASTVYRVFISVRILLFVAGSLFMLGVVLAAAAVTAWLIVPLGKFVHYLLVSPELTRVRGRAIVSTVIVFGGIIATIGLLPRPDHWRIDGVVEPEDLAFVFAEEAGFIQTVVPSGVQVVSGGEPLVRTTNPQLEAQQQLQQAELARLGALLRQARAESDGASAQIAERQMQAVTEQLARTQKSLNALAIRAPLAGQWISPDIDHAMGAYLKKGDRVGLVADMNNMIIRGTANQRVAAMLLDAQDEGDYHQIEVEFRVKGRAGGFDENEETFTGRIREIYPSGQKALPSAALGYQAGGSVATNPEDARQAAEQFFEIIVVPDGKLPAPLLPGQRIVIRLRLADKPLAQQWKQSLLQLVQRRFSL